MKGVIAVLVVLLVASLLFLQFEESRNQTALLTGLVEASIRQIDDLRDRQHRNEYRVERVGERLSGRLDELQEDIALQGRQQRFVNEEIHALRNSVSRDIDRLYSEVLHPSVQVSGRTGVGGGVIVYSHQSETFVVTAFHVVQKVVWEEDGEEKRDPVEVKFYTLTGVDPRLSNVQIIAEMPTSSCVSPWKIPPPELP